ncbi:unnamed protein product [Coregonus sp. 'balchen']|nr:unnamed protein product [Coregonus sp. 'balchen']
MGVLLHGLRNPSMAFYQAFQSGSRLRDSKAHSDSELREEICGTNDVTGLAAELGGHSSLEKPADVNLLVLPPLLDSSIGCASGASVVAIDNKIEQAMDLVKSHLMYAVREEVEVLKEQIKELFERNSMLEQENAVLKSLANSDQLSELSVRPAATNSSCSTPPQQGVGQGQLQLQLQAPPQAQAQPQTQQPQLQPQQLQPQPQPQQLQPQQPQLDASQPSPQPQPNVNSA